MKKSADSLKAYLETQLEEKVNDISTLKNRTNELYKKYKFPIDISTDYLTLRTSMVDVTDYYLFMFLSVVNASKLEEYFTDKEIKYYGKTKFNTSQLEFPLTYRMVEVTPDQWIGTITAKELMLLRDAQKINYNENAQRTMQHVVRGEKDYYKIYLNMAAVNAIQKSFDENRYIPNTITLNLSENAEYYYDKEESKLVIYSLDHFDIVDGYHRFVALSKETLSDEAFDYSMELRIVCFNESKANQFIWQEDQKTKMRKLDSDSLNQSDEANRIVQRINSDPLFNLMGEISRNDKVINSALFAHAIRLTYDLDKSNDRVNKITNINRIQTELVNCINSITMQNPNWLKERWNKKLIFSIVVCSSVFKNSPELSKNVNVMYEELEKPQWHKRFQPTIISKATVKRMIEFIRNEERV